MRWFERSSPLRQSLFVGAIGSLIVGITSMLKVTPFNNYALFADALLHGRLWIDWPGSQIDAVLYNGHRFIVNDPVPGLLMVPSVAIFGLAANQTILSIQLAGVATGAAWNLCRVLRATTGSCVWLTAFFLLGTDLWWCSYLGDVWFIAQTSAVAFLTLSLGELWGRNRPWLVAGWFVLATGSRFTEVMALPIIFAVSMLRANDGDAGRVRRAWREWEFVIIPAALIWATYNELRWGIPWDAGHTIFYHQDTAGSTSGSPFGLSHVPNQLWSFFVAPPAWLGAFPWFKPDINGTALTWTSPALVLALLASRPRLAVLSMWISAIVTAIPSMLYYMNGYAQFGMRHALDFMPFLFVLMVLGTRGRMPTWGRVLIAYSVAATAFGVWFWRTYYRP